MDNLEEIIERQSREINRLNSEVQELSQMLNEIIQLISKNMTVMNKTDILANSNKLHLDNMIYEILDPRRDVFYPIIKSIDETLDEIIKNRKSIARFGDGEFAQIFKQQRHKFQRLDAKLGERLLQVLNSNEERLLIGLADNYGSLADYTDEAADGIRDYMLIKGIRNAHEKILSKNKIYYNAYITRPYVLYKDNMTEAPQKRFKRIKQIWNDRDVIIIEGSQTRLGVGNDLLSNAGSIRRILGPATNSFDKYDEILEVALSNVAENVLFLVALGPCAGVLVYDLTIKGYQAVDIGHVDLEYEWFKAGKGCRVPVANKYNNELKGGERVGDIIDKDYMAQIIADLS